MTPIEQINPQDSRILTSVNRDQLLLSKPERPRIAILSPVDEDGVCYLGDRWLKPFLDKELDIIIIPVGSENVSEIIDNVDGLLLPGGNSNIHPQNFIEGPHQEDDGLSPAGERDLRRDEFAIELIKEAYAKDIPTLGICRGMQEMLVAFGCPLEELDEENGEKHGAGYNKMDSEENLDTLVHDITIQAGALFEELYSLITKAVNSIHKYGAKRENWNLSDTFNIEALSPDNVIEGISAKAKQFFVGVQAHFELFGEGRDSWHRPLFNRYCEKIDERFNEGMRERTLEVQVEPV